MHLKDRTKGIAAEEECVQRLLVRKSSERQAEARLQRAL